MSQPVARPSESTPEAAWLGRIHDVLVDIRDRLPEPVAAPQTPDGVALVSEPATPPVKRTRKRNT